MASLIKWFKPVLISRIILHILVIIITKYLIDKKSNLLLCLLVNTKPSKSETLFIVLLIIIPKKNFQKVVFLILNQTLINSLIFSKLTIISEDQN